MTAAAVFTVIAGVLAFIGAMYAWRFVVTYRRFRWEEYAAGRHLMRFTTGIAIILSWSVFGLALRWYFGNHEWVAIVIDIGRILIFGWCAVMLFIRYQLLEESEEDRERNQDEHVE